MDVADEDLGLAVCRFAIAKIDNSSKESLAVGSERFVVQGCG